MSLSGSPHMVDDVIVHGDLIEFLNFKRCEACQTRNRKCIIKHGDEACLICTDAERVCVFERRIRLRGPAHRFTWDSLLAKEPLIQVPEKHASTWNREEILGLNHLSSQKMPAIAQSSFINSATTAHVSRNAQLSPQGTKRRSLLKKFSTLCTAVLAFREAGRGYQATRAAWNRSPHPVQIFDNQMNPLKHRRRLSESARKKAAQIRKIGACDSCRRKKRRCEHVLANISDNRNGSSAEPSNHQISGNSSIVASNTSIGVDGFSVGDLGVMVPTNVSTSPLFSSERSEVPTRSKSPHLESS